MKCFIDLDGVLVDFIPGALKAHSRKMPEWPPGEWSLAKILSMTEEQFWVPMCSLEYWLNLLPTAEHLDILKAAAEEFGEEVYLLTSPAETPLCAAGKTAWVNHHLPTFARKLILTSNKHLLAGRDRVLVDDSDAHCTAFRKAGGRAVLVPRVWNSHHRFASQCLSTTLLELTDAAIDVRDWSEMKRKHT